jgi:hypothetical protein
MEMLSSYADVNQIAGVETFRIEFENTPSSVSQSIYANTRNQVPVVISLKAYGSDGELLKLDPENVKNKLSLHYKRASAGVGEQLSWRNTSGALSYDDRKNKYCIAASHYELSMESVQPTTVRADDGTVYVTYYISANQENNAGIDVIAVLKSPALPGGSIDTAGSVDSIPVSAVNIRALPPVTYKREDIKWEWQPNQTKDKKRVYPTSGPVLWTDVYTHNYYLSCNKLNFKFVHFERHAYSSQSGQDGLAGWMVGNDWGGITCVFAHEYRKKETMSFVYKVKGIMDPYYINTYPDAGENYFCCTWLTHSTGGWKVFNTLPQGAMTSWHQYFSTSIDTYDQYGNHGVFYLDTKNIGGGLEIYDHKII